jgi:hypothetical protein
MHIVSALFVENFEMRQAAGPSTRLDLTGAMFSMAAPSPAPVTVTPHLVALIYCSQDEPGQGVFGALQPRWRSTRPAPTSASTGTTRSTGTRGARRRSPLARSRDVPVLLSVGYSSCHWCHVMAHESFEDDAVAEVMNELFVNVKVDREERPDVDAVYMEAVQAMTGRGGWPMTVFMAPTAARSSAAPTSRSRPSCSCCTRSVDGVAGQAHRARRGSRPAR